LHWFTGSKAEAQRALELGCYFSINAAMLESERHASMTAVIPLDRLLTETDGPFTKTDERPSIPADVGVACRCGGSGRSAWPPTWDGGLSGCRNDTGESSRFARTEWRAEERFSAPVKGGQLIREIVEVPKKFHVALSFADEDRVYAHASPPDGGRDASGSERARARPSRRHPGPRHAPSLLCGRIARVGVGGLTTDRSDFTTAGKRARSGRQARSFTVRAGRNVACRCGRKPPPHSVHGWRYAAICGYPNCL